MTEPTRPPICHACKHFMHESYAARHDAGCCGNPKLYGFSPVFGRSVPYAATERMNVVGDCGPDGKLFEAAPPHVAKNDDMGLGTHVFGLVAIGAISAAFIAIFGFLGYVGVMAIAQWWRS